eukprot:1147411-Pelagomonas_calceolata.AAC.2
MQYSSSTMTLQQSSTSATHTPHGCQDPPVLQHASQVKDGIREQDGAFVQSLHAEKPGWHMMASSLPHPCLKRKHASQHHLYSVTICNFGADGSDLPSPRQL